MDNNTKTRELKMHLTILLFYPSVLYSKLIKSKQILWFSGARNALGVRILMMSYTCILVYYKVSIASITEIFVTLLF